MDQITGQQMQRPQLDRMMGITTGISTIIISPDNQIIRVKDQRGSSNHSGRNHPSQQGLLLLLGTTIRGGRIFCPKITVPEMRMDKVPLGVPIQVNLDRANSIITMVINEIIIATKVTTWVISEVITMVMDSRDVTQIGNVIIQTRDPTMGEDFIMAMIIIKTGNGTMEIKDIMTTNARIQG